MDKDTKKKAAIAGVIQLLQAEKEAATLIEPEPKNYPSPWAFYSRQNIMNNREMLQRRVVKR